MDVREFFNEKLDETDEITEAFDLTVRKILEVYDKDATMLGMAVLVLAEVEREAIKKEYE